MAHSWCSIPHSRIHGPSLSIHLRLHRTIDEQPASNERSFHADPPTRHMSPHLCRFSSILTFLGPSLSRSSK